MAKSHLHQSVSKTLQCGEGQQTVVPRVLLHGVLTSVMGVCAPITYMCFCTYPIVSTNVRCV